MPPHLTHLINPHAFAYCFLYCGIGLRIGRLDQVFQCQAVENNSERLAAWWVQSLKGDGGRGEKVSLWPECGRFRWG